MTSNAASDENIDKMAMLLFQRVLQIEMFKLQTM